MSDALRAVLGRYEAEAASPAPAPANAGPPVEAAPANAIIYTPDDIRGMLSQLRADYDVVNVTARGNAAWDIHYGEFVRYADAKLPDIGWNFSTGYADVEEIRDRRAQLEQWKAKLAAGGVRVDAPPRAEPPREPLLPDLGIPSWLLLLAAGLLAWKVAK